MQGRLCGLCPHLPLHPFPAGAWHAHRHFSWGSRNSLLSSLPCHPPFTYRHSSYVMKTEPSQRSHTAPLCPQPLEEPFLTQSRPSQGWQSHRQSGPMVLLPSPSFSFSLALLLSHCPAGPVPQTLWDHGLCTVCPFAEMLSSPDDHRDS